MGGGAEGAGRAHKVPPLPPSPLLLPGCPFTPRPHQREEVQVRDVGTLGLSEPLPEKVPVTNFQLCICGSLSLSFLFLSIC